MNTGEMGPFATFEDATAAEYVVTSRSGAYSSSTICGANARRYHALLAAPIDKPRGFYVMLSSLEGVLGIGAARVFLSTAEYPGAVFPEGYRNIKSFTLAPVPTFVYDVRGIRLRKRIYMAPRERTVVVQYELLTRQGDITLDLRPLFAARPRHSLVEANVAASLSVDEGPGGVSYRPYEALPPVRMAFEGQFVKNPQWHRHAIYRFDREGGGPAREDLVSPGFARVALEHGRPAHFLASLEEAPADAATVVAEATEYAADWMRPARRASRLARTLAFAMKDFLIDRDGREAGVVKGLPWDHEWARAAFMALAGLVALGKFAEAEKVLSAWAGRARSGVLPAYVNDAGELGPPDMEGTLWFFEAVEQLLSRTRNYDWVRATVRPFMRDCLDAVERGVEGVCRIGGDGLLYTSASGRIVAPRQGEFALVETQALYFNALKVMEDIATHFRDSAAIRRCDAAAKAIQRAYNSHMWNSDLHLPLDLVAPAPAPASPVPPVPPAAPETAVMAGGGQESEAEGTPARGRQAAGGQERGDTRGERQAAAYEARPGGPGRPGQDMTLRPMCLYSVALSHPILVRRRWEILVDQVETALMTPRGLLAAPADTPGVKVFFRDESAAEARGRGGIWPVFLGAFLAAHTRTFGSSPRRSRRVARYLAPLEAAMARGLMNHTPEFFDAVEPFTPRGAPADAAATGQLIWALQVKA